MTVMLCKSFFKSLESLNASDTKRVTDFMAKFHANPANPGISLERVTRIKDRNLWSARITVGLRAIIYKEGDTWALMYAGQHDDAYAWAGTHKVELNARTGALQIVEFTESVEALLPEKPQEQCGLFDSHNDDYLLSLGLPPNWLPVMRKLVKDNDLLTILDKLPEEVGERLFRLATGELVTPPSVSPNQPISENEDTQRRFITVKSGSELAKLLEAPMASWIGFLHPSQRKLATGSFKGPVKVTGTAGTGKSVVAMHRARYLAQQGHRVLLTSFVKTLCDNLERNLKLFCESDELEQITVTTVASQAGQILKQAKRYSTIASDEEIQALIDQNWDSTCPMEPALLWLEWKTVIQFQGIASWDEYRTANRIGRGQALTLKGRKQVWQVFEAVQNQLRIQQKLDWATFYRQARELIVSGQVERPVDAVIVDEVQDLKPQELMFLAALAGDRPNGLMLVGDGGQRIYQGRFTLKSLGINVQGRSHILKINYRTTEQIRRFADRMTHAESDDLDGNTQSRRGTVSLLNGPEPTLKACLDEQQQSSFVVSEIKTLLQSGVKPNEIAIFSRTKNLLKPIEKCLQQENIAAFRLDDQEDLPTAISTGSMHRAKGLEFKVVFVVHVSENVIPLPQSLKNAVDPQARKEVLEQEQHLLYVSITRARDLVYLCWVDKPSPLIK
ncbi:3'-5' exonuclease [Leptolyngbya sp. AN03gr2]|uniref:3'-5' exonuclease n=1 Tax=unclassified Leptolyngbya TaxID=2650499 RepID=UPI003D3202C6